MMRLAKDLMSIFRYFLGKSYHKALVIIHPDKVRQKFGGDMDKVFVADKVFDQVRDAFKAFSDKEL